ncbi:MAG TPA: YncE family protein [Gemmatimonadaceae bacterium]|nr:YncE family protein [Gemmatimonadaceae bacterium]
MTRARTRGGRGACRQALTALCCAALGTSPALSQTAPTAPPSADTPYSLYVSSESGDIVTRIEVASTGWHKAAEIPVGLLPSDIDGPHNVSVSPDGRFWYVSIAHGMPFGFVWKFTTGSDTLVGRVQVGMFPTTIGLSPDGNWAYVPNSDFHGDRGHMNTVSVLYTPTMTSVAAIPTCDMPHGSKWNHHGTVVYIACMMSDELVTIDPSTFDIGRRVSLGSGHPMTMAEHEQMADHSGPATGPGAASSTMAGQNPDCLTTYVSVSPDDSRIYLACNHSGELQVRDARTLDLIKRLPTGAGAYNVEPSPDGRFVLVTNKKAQSVSIVSATTLAELSRVPTSKKIPHGIAFSPDGRYAFVSCESVGSDPGAVDAIDLATLQRVASMPVPLQPTGIALWRGTGPTKGITH